MAEQSKDTLYPVLPLRDIVVFPHMIVPLFVGREESIQALEAAMEGEKRLFLANQKGPKIMLKLLWKLAL